MAPWSPLIWRSHKMRRVVGSTLAAETQSLLNGLGHAEWIAAHFAEALNGHFFLRRFQIQCIVDATSLCDHLISLSSPSSVEDKLCGFDLVISRQCMQRLGATIRWAPTNRQLADAFDEGFCRSSGHVEVNCLLNTSFLSERQQNDPDVSNDKHLLNLHHYRVSQSSHQMFSWFKQESV